MTPPLVVRSDYCSFCSYLRSTCQDRTKPVKMVEFDVPSSEESRIICRPCLMAMLSMLKRAPKK